jgi:hypothetical protein
MAGENEANLDIQLTLGVTTGFPVTFLLVSDDGGSMAENGSGAFLNIVDYLPGMEVRKLKGGRPRVDSWIPDHLLMGGWDGLQAYGFTLFPTLKAVVRSHSTLSPVGSSLATHPCMLDDLQMDLVLAAIANGLAF